MKEIFVTIQIFGDSLPTVPLSRLPDLNWKIPWAAISLMNKTSFSSVQLITTLTKRDELILKRLQKFCLPHKSINLLFRCTFHRWGEFKFKFSTRRQTAWNAGISLGTKPLYRARRPKRRPRLHAKSVYWLEKTRFSHALIMNLKHRLTVVYRNKV